MSSDTPVTPPAAVPVPASGSTRAKEIRIVRHTTLFYWWPVWAVGFLMSLITLLSGQRLAVVPAETQAMANQEIPGYQKPRDILIAPEGAHLLKTSAGQLAQPTLHISRSKNLGVLYCTILLLVIFITNVPLRGLWSVIVIGMIIAISIIFALLDWWEPIMNSLSVLDIRINLGGYFFISAILFVLWLIVFVFFDKQIYMVFSPGQLRVKLEIGDAETAYDTTGMTIQKERSDLFRHWILGLGSGDLVVKTSGAQAHHFEMSNVLFLGRKVKEIEEMLRTKQMVTN